MKLTEQQANEVFDILVAECGACDSNRKLFVYHITRGCREYRCCYIFGFGGKFYSDTMCVDGYPEDMTPDRKAIRDRTNARLAELMERWQMT